MYIGSIAPFSSCFKAAARRESDRARLCNHNAEGTCLIRAKRTSLASDEDFRSAR